MTYNIKPRHTKDLLLVSNFIIAQEQDYTLVSTMVTVLFTQRSSSVEVKFQSDNVALEPDETFELELVQSPSITLPAGEGVFFVNRIQMTIKDNDRKLAKLFNYY